MSEYAPTSDLTRTLWKSPVGTLGLVARHCKLARISLRPDPDTFEYEVERTYGEMGREDRETLAEPVRQLEEYFAGRRLVFKLPLDLDQGTPFQRRVWKSMLQIPYGETATYRQIAEDVGRPAAVRAVGAAAGTNPIPIVVPCHRVVAAGGKLGGYGGGLPMKTRLLDLETRTRMEASAFGMLSESKRGTYRPRPWR
jgi:O-6-methylguanine DNA methyltransferase